MVAFKTTSEMIKELSELDFVDLSSPTTSKEDAVKHCSKVLKTLFRGYGLYLRKKDINSISTTLKKIGCTTYQNADEHFTTSEPYDSLTAKNDIGFPLSLFSQLIDTSYSSFMYGFEKAFDGDEHSWVADWLKAQGEEFTPVTNDTDDDSFQPL